MSDLDLRLTPNRSLDRADARLMVAAVAAVFLLGGVRLVMLGAWPVIPFMVADVALLGWALAASYRAGAAFETVVCDGDGLVVRQVSARGVERRIRLEPGWARVDLERVSDLENRLWLTARDVRVAVGGFLSPREREEVAAVIAAGLARARRGAAD